MSSSDRNGNQAQRAGSDSLQILAGGDVHFGLSEERAHEIARATAREIISEFTEEAKALVQDRILKLDDRVIASLIREGRMHVFTDPGFLRTYKRAQEGAAVTEREADYDLLAALLTDRAERGDDRPVRAGIERAIEIIDQIDDEALRGLTVMQAVMQYRPAGGDIELGLDVMNRLLGQLLDGPLPTGSDWLDHLDVLNAARLNQSDNFQKFQNYWPKMSMPGYLSVGVEQSSNAKPWTHKSLDLQGLLVDHRLKEGFIRVSAPTKDALEKYLTTLDPDAVQAVLTEADEIYHLSDIDESCLEPFMSLVREIPALAQIEKWWDSIPNHTALTSVGRVLARANAERLDVHNILPPLN